MGFISGLLRKFWSHLQTVISFGTNVFIYERYNEFSWRNL